MRYGPILLMYVVHVNTRILILTSDTEINLLYIAHSHDRRYSLLYFPIKQDFSFNGFDDVIFG